MVDGSACEVIDTGIVKVTGRDRTVRTLEAVRYVSKARYNLISIRVLDKEGCRIQVQKGVITVSQGDRVILKERSVVVIQAERRTLSLRWSFKYKLEREFIMR